MEGGYNTKQPLPQPSRSPIPSLTPVKPTGWGDDITTPEADTYQGYGYNHDNRTVSIEVPTDDKSTQEWSQTPWVKGLPPGLNEAAVDLTPSTHQSSGSYSSGAKATTEMSRWESSPPLTEATPPSPFDVHEGKMGGSRGTGGGRSVDGGETKVAPIILPLEDRLFKAGSTSEGSWPKWYYMDQQDPTKEIYGPFDAPMMIALYKGMNCLGPTIFLLGIDPSVSLDSSPPPKSLFRPLPQLERLCLSDGEGAYEGFRCYTPIDEYRLKEAKARSPLLGREPPAEVFAAFMDQQNDDSSYDRDQGETVRVRGDSGYEGNGELDGPREEDQIVLPVQDEVRANEDVGEVGKDWVKEWGA